MERKSKNLELFIIDNDNLKLDLEAFEEIVEDVLSEFIYYDIDKELLYINFELHIYYREKDINSFDFKEYSKVIPFYKEVKAYLPGYTWDLLFSMYYQKAKQEGTNIEGLPTAGSSVVEVNKLSSSSSIGTSMAMLKQLLIDYASDFIIANVNIVLQDGFYITKISLQNR